MRHLSPITFAICGFAMIATAVVPDSARGQTIVPLPDSGCYVPKSGAAYVIQRPTTPSDCVRKSHFKFQWSGPAIVLSGGTETDISFLRSPYVGPFMYPGFGACCDSEVEVPLPSGGTLSNVRFHIGQQLTAGSWTFRVLKNGLNTALSCSINALAGTKCIAAGSVTFAPGDKIAVFFIVTVDASPDTRMSWVATLQ